MDAQTWGTGPVGGGRSVTARLSAPSTISDTRAVGPLSQYYIFENHWCGTVDEQTVTVFAGALKGRRSQGILVVRSMPKDVGRVGGRQFLGPRGGGVLRILDSQGSRLKVGTKCGGTFWFDASPSVQTSALQTA